MVSLKLKLSTLPLIPIFLRLYQRLPWTTSSNSLEKSMKAEYKTFMDDKYEFRIPSSTNMLSSEPLPGLEPSCASTYIRYSSAQVSSLVFIIRMNNLPKTSSHLDLNAGNIPHWKIASNILHTHSIIVMSHVGSTLASYPSLEPTSAALGIVWPLQGLHNSRGGILAQSFDGSWSQWKMICLVLFAPDTGHVYRQPAIRALSYILLHWHWLVIARARLFTARNLPNSMRCTGIIAQSTMETGHAVDVAYTERKIRQQK